MKTSIAALLLLSLVAACGKDDDDSGPELPVTAMEGSWTKACVADEEGTGSHLDVVEVENLTLRSIITFYSNTNCQTASFSLRASLEILASTTKAASPADTYDLDMSISRIIVTPQADETVVLFNLASAFGISTWVLNGATDVSGKNFEGDADPETVKGTKFYDIFKVAGTNLNFGDDESGNGSTVATRATVLDTVGFVKK